MILRLKNDGDEATLNISTAAVVQGQYGEQVKFDTGEGDTLYVPIDSVRRQLDRTGVAEIEDLSGKTLHFGRVAGKNGVIFWNIDGARPQDVPGVHPKTNGKPVVAQQPDPPKKNPNAKTVPGGTDDSEYADSLVEEEKEPTPFDALCAKYRECFSEAVSVSALATTALNLEVSSEALAAMAATLFIARNQKSV